MYEVMIDLNNIYFKIHFIFAFLIPFSMIKPFKYNLIKRSLIVTIYSLLIFILITSGVSNRQGDRLILPSIGCWPAIYSIVLFLIFNNKNLFFRKIRFI